VSPAAAFASFLKGLVFDWRAWAVAAIGGLALTLWIVTGERDRAVTTSDERRQTVEDLRGQLATAEAGRSAAQAGKARAEQALGDYARETFVTFSAQAEASRLMAAQLAETNRRLTAAQQEIARADGSLRLDDPLPRGVRDALACTGGDTRACAPAAAADPGRVPAGAAEHDPAPRPVAGGAVGA